MQTVVLLFPLFLCLGFGSRDLDPLPSRYTSFSYDPSKILMIQNYNPGDPPMPYNSIPRSKCYAEKHGYDYLYSDSTVLVDKLALLLKEGEGREGRRAKAEIDFSFFVPEGFEGGTKEVAERMERGKRWSKVPRRWMTPFQVLLAFATSRNYLFSTFSNSTHSVAHAPAHSKLYTNHLPYEWVLYTDVDALPNDSERTLQALLLSVEAKYPHCFFVAQDYHHIINSGFLLFRRTQESVKFLQLWMSQWLDYHDMRWIMEQGYLQETVLLYLSPLVSPPLPPYTPHSCRKEKPHPSNLCYADRMTEWGLKYSYNYKENQKIGRISEGICLISPFDPVVQPPFNRHDDPKSENDLFLHWTNWENAPVAAKIFRDDLCPHP